jgi:hypothetical protein
LLPAHEVVQYSAQEWKKDHEQYPNDFGAVFPEAAVDDVNYRPDP